MIEALQKGDEVVTAGGIARPHHKVGDSLPHARDRTEHRDPGAEVLGPDGPAQGHHEERIVKSRRDRRALFRRSASLPAPQSLRSKSMNRYPLWKYMLIAVVLLVGVSSTRCRISSAKSPAVQMSAGKSTRQGRRSAARRASSRRSRRRTSCHDGVFVEPRRRASCASRDTDTQLRAKDVLARELGRQTTWSR